MNSLFVAFLFLVLSSCGDARTKISGRIVGGDDAADGLAPYQISLQTDLLGDNVHICGGSIISDHWIVTAAHCIDEVSSENLTIVVGTNSLSRDGQRYKLEKCISHENYSRETVKNDIGLCKVSTNITYGEKIQPIKLPSSDVEAGKKALLTGWGYTDFDTRRAPDKLQKAILKTQTLKQCNRNLKDFETILPIDKKQVCAYAGRGTGGCSGDSGGPLVINGTLIGVVSFGVPCGEGYDDVFTNVYAYVDWIHGKM
ncbi:chymotrypsin-2-like [Pieris rapae]|uniref:chymotrypsin-2-like n=1 Tax=Pieris rapae TaxID=64459 RepID=UPI001E27C3A8|nr:chymotrypsin-2-like [Pieris rapae]XP_045488740.1 chymotrypsin-2-like [Pieris rapae]